MVDSDVAKGKIVGGVPAKVIGKFDELAKKKFMYRDHWAGVKKEEMLGKLRKGKEL